jgi:glutaredoxin 3
MEFVDVKADPSRMPEMLKHSNGGRKVPVIVQDGKVTIGYGGS